MAQTIAEIKATMTSAFIANETIINLYGLIPGKTFEEQFSKVSLESILFFIVASAIWIVEVFFDEHKAEVNEIIETKRPHTIDWYRQTALEFQYGYELSEESGEYDNTNLTEDEILASLIITKCSVQKTTSIKPTIIIKVATDAGALTDLQKTAFDAYMNKKADAGVYVVILTGNPDRLALWLKIIYDPLVLDSNGVALVGGNKPIDDAIKEHLRTLKFNGVFVSTYMLDALQKIDGIIIPIVLESKASQYGFTLSPFSEIYAPYSGAIEIDVENDLHVTYEAVI